jgi:hypothetical protein
LKINPSFPPFAKGRNYPSLEKRGEGRFSEEYAFSIMDFLVIDFKSSFRFTICHLQSAI